MEFVWNKFNWQIHLFIYSSDGQSYPGRVTVFMDKVVKGIKLDETERQMKLEDRGVL